MRPAAEPWQARAGRTLFDVRVPTRSGLTLATDLYLPDRLPAPALLLRTPYGKQWQVYVAQARRFARHGYVVAIQDVRGRQDSEGDWTPYVHEADDGYDTVDWLVRQDGLTTGRVGTFGSSYSGWCQWATASRLPAGLSAMVATASCGYWMHELPRDHGIPWLIMFGWLWQNSARTRQDTSLVDWADVYRTIPLARLPEQAGRDMPEWASWLEHDRLDPYWRRLRLDDAFADISVPVLHITGTYDDEQPGALYFYDGMRDASRASQALLVGPWDHDGAREPSRYLDGRDFGSASVLDLDAHHLAWFDRHLRDAGESWQPAPFTVYVTGSETWSNEDPARSEPREFPLADAVSPVSADADADRDSFTADPADPVSDGNYDPFLPDTAAVSVRRPELDGRDDVLWYAWELAEGHVLYGRPTLRLYVSTSAADADVFAYLFSSTDTGGRELRSVSRRRLSWDESTAGWRRVVAGRVYRLELRFSFASHAFRAGDRLHVAIAGSDFPTYAVNPGVPDPHGDVDVRVSGTTSVWRCEAADSSLVLPLLAAGYADVQRGSVDSTTVPSAP